VRLLAFGLSRQFQPDLGHSQTDRPARFRHGTLCPRKTLNSTLTKLG
jgi:hypothetical protein